jgi:hypothetical protein
MTATSKDRSGRVLMLAFIGLVAGWTTFAVFHSSAGSSAFAELAELLPGSLLILSGSWGLFSRAAFPDRFREPDRVRRAVMNAAGILIGCALLLKHGLTIPLGAPALTAMVCAALGWPKSVFDPTV